MCAGTLILPTAVASAHAVFVSAYPAPGASLARPPASIRIVFSEPLTAALSGIRLLASSGTAVAERRPGVDPSDRSAYEAGLPPLRPGRYTVLWHTTSAVDGHSRWGSYNFTVLLPGGGRPPGPPVPVPLAAPAALPVPAQAVASWLGLAGLFLIAGAVLMLLLGAAPGGRPGGGPAEQPDIVSDERARRALGWLLAVGAAACACGVAGQAAASWAGVGWAWPALAAVLTQGVAHWWWLRLAAVTTVLLACHRPARLLAARRVAAIAAVAALAVSFAAAGHGEASASPAAGLVVMAVHVLAGSVWLGGVLGLATLWALAGRDRALTSGLRLVLRRFSVVAGMAVPAVAATGAASALLELGRIDDLITSGYGRALLIKLAAAGLAGLAALVGIRARRASPDRPRQSQRARASLLLEAGLGMALLIPTAVMSVLAPPGPAEALRSAARQIAAGTDPAASFTGYSLLRGRGVAVSLTPGAAGMNAVRAEVDGSVSAPRLAIQLSGPGGSSTAAWLRRAGTDHDPQPHSVYTGAVSLGRAGNWQALVRGLGGVSQPVLVPVRAAAAPAAQLGSRAGWLLVIVLSGASVTVLAGIRGARRRRWRAGSAALGGAGCLAAAGWAGVLAIAPAVAAPALPAGWGTARRVAPVSAAGATVWPVGGADAGLMMPAVAPDGSVWVGEMNTGKLAELSPASRVVREVALPGGGDKEVMGVAVDRSGRVWVAEEHAQELGMFDPATGRYRQYRIPGASPAPVGIAVAPDGNVWFTEMNGDSIGRFDPAAGEFAQFRLPTPGALPYWLAIAPDGRVWFTEFGAGKVGVLRPATGRIRQYRLPRGQTPAGIAIGPAGTPWLATTEGRLLWASPVTGRLRQVRSPAASSYGVAVTGDGVVWLGTTSGSAVYAYNPRAGTFRRCPLPEGQAPWWIAAAGGRRVWAALSGPGAGGLAELAECG